MSIFNMFKNNKNKQDNSKNKEIVELVKEKIKRKATLMEIGGFRPDENLDSSWFGKVLLSLPGEKWPTTNGDPMHALCQINMTQLPYIPEGLKDIEFITIFIGPHELPVDNDNGDNWCLRAYKKINELVPLEQVKTKSYIKEFQMKGKLIEDYPCWEDFHSIELNVSDEIENNLDDYITNVSGFKIGGWPTLIQSEIDWGAYNHHPIKPEYIFQIDSTEKGNFMWGDSGVGYFGRGTKEGHQDEWAIEWQCF